MFIHKLTAYKYSVGNMDYSNATFWVNSIDVYLQDIPG